MDAKGRKECALGLGGLEIRHRDFCIFLGSRGSTCWFISMVLFHSPFSVTVHLALPD